MWLWSCFVAQPPWSQVALSYNGAMKSQKPNLGRSTIPFAALVCIKLTANLWPLYIGGCFHVSARMRSAWNMIERGDPDSMIAPWHLFNESKITRIFKIKRSMTLALNPWPMRSKAIIAISPLVWKAFGWMRLSPRAWWTSTRRVWERLFDCAGRWRWPCVWNHARGRSGGGRLVVVKPWCFPLQLPTAPLLGICARKGDPLGFWKFVDEQLFLGDDFWCRGLYSCAWHGSLNSVWEIVWVLHSVQLPTHQPQVGHWNISLAYDQKRPRGILHWPSIEPPLQYASIHCYATHQPL